MTLIEQLEHHFSRYLAIDPRLPLVLALWSLATHLFEVFDAFPYLAITSPTPRCGKTRVAELLELVCTKPMRTVGLSVAVLFRTIEQDKPTLIVDEAENLRGRDDLAKALLQVLNAGYRKGQMVKRCEGGNGRAFRVKDYRTYSPKVFVLIGDLSHTLADRSICIRMQRKITAQKIDRFRFARAQAETASLKKECEQWAASNKNAVENRYDELDLAFLEDREAELWLPLVSVCSELALDRLPELESVARELAGSKATDEPAELNLKLLADIREIFDRRKCDRLRTADLVSDLNESGESPWSSFNDGSGINANGLAKYLRPFGIQSKNIRHEDNLVLKGYTRDDFEEAWAIYLSDAIPIRYAATEAVFIEGNSNPAAATD